MNWNHQFNKQDLRNKKNPDFSGGLTRCLYRGAGGNPRLTGFRRAGNPRHKD